MSWKVSTRWGLIGAMAVAGCARKGPGAWFTPKTIITVETTMCFGECPAYRLRIAGDGTASFDGQKFTAVSGKRETRLKPEELRSLAAAFDEAGFFALHDTYVGGLDGCGEVATDSPSTVITVLAPGLSKTVDHYHGCRKAPQNLRNLEKTIEASPSIAPMIRSPRG